MSETPHEIILKITTKIIEADQEAVGSLRMAEILRWHLDEDVEIIARHEPIEHKTRPGEHYCFWCSEDGVSPIIVPWPCPEIRSVAKSVGAEI